jgi:dipeptide/tripeptide permease
VWAPFLYPSEIFPAQSRAKGSSFGVVGFALGSFLCNMISPYLFSAVQHNALFLFGGLSLLVSIVCFFLMPETANKSLEDIDHLFD